MLLVHAVFGLLPWYVWVLVVLALIAITYLGLWAPVIALLRKVPWQVWVTLGVGIAVVVAFNAWLEVHDAGVIAKEKGKCDADKKAANDAAEKRAAALQRQLELATNAAAIAAQKAKAEADRRVAALTARITDLEKERPHDITPEANDRCHLTRGVIVHFNRGALAANGSAEAQDSAAAGRPDDIDVDAPADVSLDSYAAAIEQTQSALGTCRNQVIDWQTRYATVWKPWIDTATAALSSCIPQGATP